MRASGAIRSVFGSLLILFCNPAVIAQSKTPQLIRPWMPDWERSDILAIKKASEPKAWLAALLLKLPELPAEHRLTNLEAISDQVVLLRLLQEFLAGYGEKGVHAQFLQLTGGFLIRWPTPVDQTGGLNRIFCSRFESARKDVDQIFLARLRMPPYRGWLPVWIRENEGDTAGDRKRQIAGSTFGGALITLNLHRPEAEPSPDSKGWTVSEQDIRSLMDTARHEFVHFYINRMLGEEKAGRLPRDFHEGCATSLTDSSTIERSEIRVEMTPDGSMVRWRTIVSAPEDYQRYHLQMKYLRLAYGDATFFDFLRSVLSGADLDGSVKRSFGRDSWPELFRTDLSSGIVDRFILGRSVLLYLAASAGLALLFICWRRSNPHALWRAFGSLFQQDLFGQLAKARLPRASRTRRTVWLLLAAVIAVAAADRYLRWTNSLDIDSPDSLLHQTLLIDSWIVLLAILAFLSVGAVRIIFFRQLKKSAAQIFHQSENANADNGLLILQRLRQVNAVLRHLRLSGVILRDSRDFRDLQARGGNTESNVRAQIARDLHGRVQSLLKQRDYEAACQACSRLAPEMEGQALFQDSLAALSKRLIQKLAGIPIGSVSEAEADRLASMLRRVVRLAPGETRESIARELHSRVRRLLKQNDCEAAYRVCSLLAPEMKGQVVFQDSLAALSHHIAHKLVEMSSDPDSQIEAGKLMSMLRDLLRHVALRSESMEEADAVLHLLKLFGPA
jgi:hypothetical protein